MCIILNEPRLIMKEKSIMFLEKTRSFFMSEMFMAVILAAAMAIIIAGQEVYGTIVFAILIAILLIICDDVIATTLPFMLVCCFAAKCKNATDIFLSCWWFAFVIIFAFIFHFVAYRKNKYFKIGKSFLAILFVSIAVTLGGVGKITAEEYFAGVSIFYIIGLGFGMLFAYWIMSSSFKPSDSYNFSERFAKIMVLTAMFGCFMILHHYIINMDSFLKSPRILQFQWRNNLSTMLMLTMPFTFYMSTKKYPYMFAGMLCYGCMLLAGSRGGMLFGGIEFAICVIAFIIIDKKHRKISLGIYGTLAIVVAIFISEVEGLLDKTLERFVSFKENKIRLGLYERAIEDFKSNPISGRGLGYFGNRDIHKSAKFALCWYHSTPFQIIGSFGVVGIIAYFYQYFVRIKLFVTNRKNLFNITIFIAYVGIEMMSLVNPGVFSPIYLFVVTMFFVAIENCSTTEDMNEYKLIRTGESIELKDSVND